MNGNRQKKVSGLGFVLLLAGVLVCFAGRPAQAVPYSVGDVFAGVGDGLINHYNSTGTLLEVLDTTSAGSESTGMCFDAAGNLYATSFTASNMSKFDNQGALLTHPWGGPFSTHPESCVVDAAGNIYTGEVDGASDIRKFDPAGNLLASFDPATEARGTDWIDLAADSCTMFYTSEGSSVKRFNVCTNTQLPDFATGLTAPCYALRIRANGEVLVACTSQVYRLNSAGAPIQTYTPGNGEAGTLFALNLDPDGTSFWTGDIFTGDIYKIDINSGAVLTSFTAPPVGGSMAGLAIFGEPTAVGGDICDGPPPANAIVGTGRQDYLFGTEGDDVIFGLGGNDLIWGLGGNDTLCGGAGRDYLSGGPGDDRISGGAGDDLLYGDGGNDTLNGGRGNDTIIGGSGRDLLMGEDGNDYLYSRGGGRDQVDGGGGADTCISDHPFDALSNCP